MLKRFPVSKYHTLEQCSLLTTENWMMVLKAKLKISCSSTTFIKEVFAVDERIRKYSIIKLHYQSTMAASEPALACGIMADRL